MNFRKPKPEEPEINLIPFIDVLLVILIFLMLSTTYSKYTELQVALPVADADAAKSRAREVVVSVSADGAYSVGGTPLAGRGVEALVAALGAAAAGDRATTVIVSADAAAAHQSVINVLDAARRAGLARLVFAAQAGASAAVR